jgi:hypothetical protein
VKLQKDCDGQADDFICPGRDDQFEPDFLKFMSALVGWFCPALTGIFISPAKYNLSLNLKNNENFAK